MCLRLEIGLALLHAAHDSSSQPRSCDRNWFLHAFKTSMVGQRSVRHCWTVGPVVSPNGCRLLPQHFGWQILCGSGRRKEAASMVRSTVVCIGVRHAVGQRPALHMQTSYLPLWKILELSTGGS